MTAATVTTEFTEILPQGMSGVRLTTTATTSTYNCPYFREIISCVGNNESDNDGVGVKVTAVSSTGVQTITITVGTLGDVVTLIMAGIV